MSELKLVYSELEDAADHARKVADKCQDYIEELDSKLTNKWGSLPKSPLNAGNQRIDSAAYYVKCKKDKLKEKKKDYKAFANAVDDLREDAKRADSNVAKSVNNSRKTFLDKHKNFSGDGWAAFFASVVVDVPVIGWIADAIGTAIEGAKDIVNNIRYWYNVGGGKKIVDTVLAIAEGVLAVVGIVVAIVTFPVSGVLATIVAVAGLVAGVIGLIDSVVNICYQFRANKESDPAWAKYYGGIDKATDALRKTTFKSKFMNKMSGIIADVIDTVELVCVVIKFGDTLVKGLGKIYKRSGLNKLFSKKITIVNPGGATKYKYKFDGTKFWKTITTKEGWASIGKSIKYSWKGLIFGDSGGISGWKKRWKRAFTSNFNYKADVKIWKKIYDRGKKIYTVFTGDIKRFTTTIDTLKNIKDLFSGKKWGGEDIYKNIKNIYKIFGGSGKLTDTTTKTIEDIQKIVKKAKKIAS